MSGWARASLEQVAGLAEAEPGEARWHAVRHHFGIRAFGVNAWRAEAEGEQVIERHDELPNDGTAAHEELYVVLAGRAHFEVGGERFVAGPGELVHVADPALVRGAVAAEAGTTVLAIGAAPGEAFSVSPWEARHVRRAQEPRRAG